MIALYWQDDSQEERTRFTDNGRPYGPAGKPGPDTTLSAEEQNSGGLDIFMEKKSIDTVAYA